MVKYLERILGIPGTVFKSQTVQNGFFHTDCLTQIGRTNARIVIVAERFLSDDCKNTLKIEEDLAITTKMGI